MAIKADVASLLENWKFEQALSALDTEDATEVEIHIIGSLSRVFGDVVEFNGEMGIIVATAVEYLLMDKSDAAVR